MTDNILDSLLPPELEKNLTPAEKIVLLKIQTGELADLRVGIEKEDNLKNDRTWGPDRIVRAEFIYWLFTNNETVKHIHTKGVRLAGVKIPKMIDFECCILQKPLSIEYSSIREGIVINNARLPSLSLSNSLLGQISAKGVKVSGNLELKNIRTKAQVILDWAHIEGELNCKGAVMIYQDGYSLLANFLITGFDLALNNNYQAKGGVCLYSANIGGNLNCESAVLNARNEIALYGTNLSTKGDVFLRNGFKSNGEVNLYGSKIAGELDCKSSVLENPNGIALHGKNLSTGGDVSIGLDSQPEGYSQLTRKFQIKGEVNLYGAEIGGDLNCGSAVLKNPNGIALRGTNLSTKGHVFLNGFQSDGAVDFYGAKIGGILNCEFAVLKNTNKVALDGKNLSTQGDMFLNGFQAEGEVNLYGAKIGGDLNCESAKLRRPCGNVLNLAGSLVSGSIFLSEGFQAHGCILLYGTKIGADLYFDRATLNYPNRYALNGTNISIKGDVFLRNGFKSNGEVRLYSAKIGGDLNCETAELINPKGFALYGINLSTEGDVFLRNGFKSEGEVNLYSAKIGGILDCKNATFNNPGGIALLITDSKIFDTLFLKNLNGLDGSIELTNARAKELSDDKKSWPKKNLLNIDGFDYDRISGEAPLTVEDRLNWLSLQPIDPFRPGPYEQLAKVFRSMGKEQDAQEVLIKKNEAIRKYGDLNRTNKFWNWFLGKTISYGYKPGKVICKVIFPLIILSSIIFGYGYHLNAILPVKQNVYKSGDKTKYIVDNYPRFDPVVYSLDVFIPLVNFHQQTHWAPSSNMSYGIFCWYYIWFNISLGWILSSLVIAALTGLVRKE